MRSVLRNFAHFCLLTSPHTQYMTTNTRDTPADDDGSPPPSKKTVSRKTEDMNKAINDWLAETYGDDEIIQAIRSVRTKDAHRIDELRVWIRKVAQMTRNSKGRIGMGGT
jgi:hypothetical protein